jgi:predicted RND superfamily exporter protein
MRRLKIFLLQAHVLSLRYPKSILASIFVLFVAAAVTAKDMAFLTNLDDLVSPDFQSFVTFEKVREEFQDHNQLAFVLTPLQSRFPSKTDLCNLRGWIQDIVDHESDLLEINSTLGLRSAAWSSESIRFAPWFDLNCLSSEDQQQDIANAFQKTSASPWSKIFKSHDQNDVTVLLRIRDNAKDTRFGKFDASKVISIEQSLQAAVNPSAEDPSWKIIATGNASFLRYLKKGYDQTQVLNLLMALVAILFFRFFMGSWKAGFLYVATLMVTLTVVYGGMTLAGAPIDPLTNAIPLMVAVTCLEDFVFFLYLYRKTGHWRKSMRLTLFPGFLTSLATAIGFGSLVVSDLEMIQRFGMWTAIAALLEWCILFIGLPPLFKLYPKLIKIDFRKMAMTGLLHKITQVSPSFRLAVTLTFVFPLAIFGLKYIHISDSPEKSFSASHPVQETHHWLAKHRQWVGQVSVLFHTDDEADQRRIIASLKKDPIVSAVEDQWSAQDFLVNNLTEVRAEHTRRLWQQSPAAGRVISGKGAERAIVYTNSNEVNALEDFRHRIATQICPDQECSGAGSLFNYSEFGLRIFKTFFQSISLSLLLITIFLLIVSRGHPWKMKFFLVASSLWGSAALLLIFAIFQIPVSYSTSVCIAILDGISGDNGVHYMIRKNVNEAIDELAPASILVTLGMITLITVFYFSDFDVLRKLGAIMSLGFLLLLVGDLFILKGYLKKISL